jgi:nicotinamide-nucleotide amidase
MTASIITIGDEILVGQTVDTNSAFIARQLHAIGIKIREIISISDTEKHIKEAVDKAIQLDQFIFVTGGLGPTNDDITKKVLTNYFDDELVMYPEILSRIESFFAQFKKPFLEVNKLQALLPKNARIIENHEGTASGMWFKKNGVNVLSMPGVPYEMEGIMNQFIEIAQEEYGVGNFYHNTRLIAGIGESQLADILKDWENENRNKGITVSYLPSIGTLKLRLTGLLDQKDWIDSQLNILNELYPKFVVGSEFDTLETVIGEHLVMQNKTLGTVESCTGGALAKKIVALPGASAFFEGAIVTYSNKLKTKLVDVPAAIIAEFGAVSENVVRIMAENGKEKLDTDYTISISGVAGPSGGTVDKPVGMVWVAIACPDKTYTKCFNFGKNRARNIESTSIAALNFLRLILIGHYEDVTDTDRI